MAKCPLVNPQRLPEIEQLLHYLQNRRDNYTEQSSKKQDEAQEEANFADIGELVRFT